MGFFSRLFGRKPLPEDDTGVNPMVTHIGDEIQLCKNCPFSGKCEWPDGCASYRQLMEKRTALSKKIRGYDASVAPDNTSKRARHGLWYIQGIGWRVQIDRNSYKIVRIVKVDENTGEATVMSYDNVHEPNTRREHIVKIPLIEDKSGAMFVDLRKFRSAVKASLNEWRV